MKEPAEYSLFNSNINITETTSRLIKFDRKTKIYIFICLLLYFFFVACKWHNASIASWNSVFNNGGNEERGMIAGKPREIRSDEWLVGSSFRLAQENHHFSITNEALGYGKTPLLIGLPTNHILSIIKPVLWGYYFLDGERAFSWEWNFKIFPFLILSFLFLMLFTGNNFTLSVFGSAWLFLSSAIQSWSISTEMFTYAFAIIISLIYILYSNKIGPILLNGLIFILSSYSFALVLYPAYQVPLAYFIAALLIGYIISRKDLRLWEKKYIKASIITLSLLILFVLLYFFYQECKDTIKVLSHTAYPGSRSEVGGGFSFISMFRDNFSWYMDDSHFPPSWVNICELSSFLMLGPIVLMLVLYSFGKTRKINPLLIPFLLYLLMLYTWLFMGFPQFLAKVTLFYTSPVQRTFFIFGFSNIIFTLLYFGQFKEDVEIVNTNRKKAIVFITIFAVAFLINYFLRKQSERFFSIQQMFNATILFSVLNWLAVYFNTRKVYQHLFMAACFFFCASNIFVNPLSKGLSPYFENELYKSASAIEHKDPGAGWVVFASMTAPNLLKAAGINCFNGVQFAPQLKKFSFLDSSYQNKNIYNRYAHILFFPSRDGTDSVKFTLAQGDVYYVHMDPSSLRLKQMGIKYIVFAYKPLEIEIRDLLPIKEVVGFYIYKRKDL